MIAGEVGDSRGSWSWGKVLRIEKVGAFELGQSFGKVKSWGIRVGAKSKKVGALKTKVGKKNTLPSLIHTWNLETISRGSSKCPGDPQEWKIGWTFATCKSIYQQIIEAETPALGFAAIHFARSTFAPG